MNTHLAWRSRGQGMTEYIIIVALIAVAAIGVYSLFGKSIRNQVAGLAQEMTGHQQRAIGQTGEGKFTACHVGSGFPLAPRLTPVI